MIYVFNKYLNVTLDNVISGVRENSTLYLDNHLLYFMSSLALRQLVLKNKIKIPTRLYLIKTNDKFRKCCRCVIRRKYIKFDKIDALNRNSVSNEFFYKYQKRYMDNSSDKKVNCISSK